MYIKSLLMSVFLLVSSQTVFAMDNSQSADQGHVRLREITAQERNELLAKEAFLLNVIGDVLVAQKQHSFVSSFGPDYALVTFEALEKQVAERGITAENYQNFKDAQRFFGRVKRQHDCECATEGIVFCCIARALIPVPVSPLEIPVDIGLAACGLNLFNKMRTKHNEVEPIVCHTQSNRVPAAIVMGTNN